LIGFGIIKMGFGRKTFLYTIVIPETKEMQILE